MTAATAPIIADEPPPPYDGGLDRSDRGSYDLCIEGLSEAE